jgi:hypothetical protein
LSGILFFLVNLRLPFSKVSNRRNRGCEPVISPDYPGQIHPEELWSFSDGLFHPYPGRPKGLS